MRSSVPILVAFLLAPLLFAGCSQRKAADNESERRLAAPPAPAKNPDKPTVKMPTVPPPPPPK